MTEHEQDPPAHGWDAIDAALAPIYGAQRPRHYGSAIPAMLGGNDPLQGISAYWRDAPVPHWHFVTYGFSELYDKESDDPEVSGFGFELSFRLAADVATDEPPMWALNFLQNIARYVFQSGNTFDAGHYMNLNGPIALENDTKIRAIAFVEDAELGTMQTPNGRVDFLQVVGITEPEELALMRWSGRKALAAFGERLPLHVTDLARGDLLADPAVAALLEQGTREEGSSTGFLFVDELGWERHKRLLRGDAWSLRVGARQVPVIVDLLLRRLPFERPFALIGRTAKVRFVPGRTFSAKVDGDDLEVTLDPASVQALAAAVPPVAGRYTLPGVPELTFEVVQTHIRNQQGEVVETIG